MSSLPGPGAVAPKKAKASRRKGGKPRKAHKAKKAHASAAPRKAHKAKKRKGGKRSRSVARRMSGVWSKIYGAKGRQGTVTRTAINVGTVLLAGAGAQGVKAAYEARGGDFSPKGVDLRIPLGLAAFVPTAWAIYKSKKASPVWTNLGTGILGSYLFDKTYELAGKYAAPKAPVAEGIVVGRLGKRREKHLEKKEGRLEKRLDKLRGKQTKLESKHPGVASRPAPSRAQPGRPGGAPRRLVDNVPLYAIKPEYAKQFAG